MNFLSGTVMASDGYGGGRGPEGKLNLEVNYNRDEEKVRRSSTLPSDTQAKERDTRSSF